MRAHLCIAVNVLALSLASRALASSEGELIRQGEVHEANRMWDIAAKRYSDALQLNPTSEDAYLHLGHLRTSTGDMREAVRVYSVGLSQIPATRSLIRARATAHTMLHEYDDAAEDLKSLGDEDLTVLFELAQTYRHTQQTLGELMVWRKIAMRTQAAQHLNAVLMVKALQTLAGELDVVTRPGVTKGVRATMAALAR